MNFTGDDYFDSAEFADLLSAYEESARSGTPLFMDVDELVDIADYYSMRGDAAKAAKAIDEALDLDPGATLPLAFKAREAIAAGDMAKARACADSIANKDDLDYKYLHAELELAQDHVEAAEDCFNDIFDSVPAEEKDDVALDVAAMCLDYELCHLAHGWLQKCQDKTLADCKEMTGRVAVGLERHDEAIDIFQQLTYIQPYSKKYWHYLGNAQYLAQRYAEAIDSLDYALAIDSHHASSLIVKAHCLAKQGNFADALDFYTRYCHEVPDDAFGHLNAGSCLLTMARYEEAVAVLMRAARLDRHYDEHRQQIYESLAMAYGALGKTHKALASLDKARTDNMTTDERAVQMVLRGHVMLESGQRKEADDLFDKAIDMSGGHPDVALRVIVSLCDNDRMEEAYGRLKAFLKSMGSDFKHGYSYMALCCWHLKKYDEFAKYVGEAIRRNPAEARSVLPHIMGNDAATQQQISDLLARLNDIDD